MEFNKKYNRFPKISEIKLELKESSLKYFEEILLLDITDFDDEFLIDKIEQFFKEKLIFQSLLFGIEELKSGESKQLSNVPDKIREAVSFSFDTKVGLDVFSDEGEEIMYNHLHAENKFISTGVKSLDTIIGGGLQKPSVTCFLAESNLGKSFFKCAISSNIILQSKNVLYITMELTEQYMSQRILQNVFSLNQESLNGLTREQFKEKYRQYKKLVGNKLIVEKYAQGTSNANIIRNLVKELQDKRKFNPDVLILDYLGIFAASKIGKDSNSNEVGKIKCQEIQALSFDLDIPILTSQQCNRGGYGSSRLDPTDMADSIGIFQELDNVIGLTQSDELRALNRYCLETMKCRFADNKKTTIIGGDKSFMKIYDVDEQNKIEETKKVEETVNNITNTLAMNRQRSMSILFD